MKLLGACCRVLILSIRPMLGSYAYTDPKAMSVCIYPISCTTYATEILAQKPFLVACFFIIKRVLLCNPLGSWWINRKTACKD